MSTKKKPIPVKISIAKPTLSIKPVPDFFDILGKKAVLLVLGFIIVAELIIFKDYFFDKVYFFKDIGSDTLNALYPFMYHTADYISKYGTPKWSFNVGMGQNLFPLFLRDPFDIFLYIAGKDHILYGTLYKELAKILFGGIIFFYYLKTIRLSNYTSLIGSLLFAFCGFMIVGGGWYIFSSEAFDMSLLLLAFELLFNKQKWFLFPIAIFFIGVSMPFNLYIYGLFLVSYAILRHLQTSTFNVKQLGFLLLKMAGLGAIGLLLSAPFLIENIVQLFQSPRVNGGSSYFHILSSTPMFGIADKVQLGTSIMRFFSSEILGSGNAFKGWGNILEAPTFYCGLPCLLLMPQVFQFLDKRVKRIFIVFLIIWLSPVIFPYFRYAFWLFTGDYYRAYSFFVALVFLYYSLQALDFIIQKKKINLILLIITVIILFIAINYPFFDNDAVNTGVSFFAMFMLIVYGVLLFFIAKQKNAIHVKWVFLFAVIFELIYLTSISVNDRDAVTSAELSQKSGYNDYTVDAVKYIKKNDKSLFYRIDKSYTSSPTKYTSFNDAMVQGYYGTGSYSSFNQEYYIYYLELMGMIDKNKEHDTRSTFGLLGNITLEGENSVKYLLVKGNITPFGRVCLDSLTRFGDVKIYRSKFTLPLGYTYSAFVRESSFDSLSHKQKDHVSLIACVVKDKDAIKVKGLKEFYLKDTTNVNIFNLGVWDEDVKQLKKDTLIINQINQNFIVGKINVNENKMMYLSIPYDMGWKLKVDGLPTDKIILNAGMTGIMLKKGNHTIELKYDLRFFNTGLILFLFGILIYFGYWFYTKRMPVSVS